MPTLKYKLGHEQLALDLLAEREALVSQDDLVARLWPSKTPTGAHTALSHVICRLRRRGYVIEHVMGYRLRQIGEAEPRSEGAFETVAQDVETTSD